jgi:hypothetical protein
VAVLSINRRVAGAVSATTGTISTGDTATARWWSLNILSPLLTTVGAARSNVIRAEIGCFNRCLTGGRPCLWKNGPGWASLNFFRHCRRTDSVESSPHHNAGIGPKAPRGCDRYKGEIQRNLGSARFARFESSLTTRAPELVSALKSKISPAHFMQRV